MLYSAVYGSLADLASPLGSEGMFGPGIYTTDISSSKRDFFVRDVFGFVVFLRY